MKKVLNVFLVGILLFLVLFPSFVRAENKEVNVYLFYGKTCPHCEEAYEYFTSIEDKYNLKIYRYEVWYNDENQKKMQDVADLLDVNVSGVPFVVINNTPISGFSKGITDQTYLYHIKQDKKNDFADKVGVKLGILDESELEKETLTEEGKKQSYKISIPLIGDVKLESLSLPILSVLLGIVDGFNPCAMWILLFLISSLINMKNKKKLWILGTIFLLTSSIVYMAFMVSWLSFAKMIKGVALIRLIIAIIALVAGYLNIKNYIESLYKDDGCSVVNNSKRKKIFAKIKKIINEKSFALAIVGIIFLAASVNLIELACSAGLPVIYTQILAMNDLTSVQYALYILLYILFFMLDDLIVFAIAIKSFELAGISNKYSKYSHLIGGLIMFIIGILLIVKPEWLMFNF